MESATVTDKIRLPAQLPEFQRRGGQLPAGLSFAQGLNGLAAIGLLGPARCLFVVW
jgi:hypothetical protein